IGDGSPRVREGVANVRVRSQAELAQMMVHVAISPEQPFVACHLSEVRMTSATRVGLHEAAHELNHGLSIAFEIRGPGTGALRILFGPSWYALRPGPRCVQPAPPPHHPRLPRCCPP